MQITLSVVKFNSQVTALIDLRCLGLELAPLSDSDTCSLDCEAKPVIDFF